MQSFPRPPNGRVGGRRRAPHGRADWRRFPPTPLSTGRWVFPSPAGSERISAAAFPTACTATGSSTSPHVAGSWRVGLPPSPLPEDLTMRRAAIPALRPVFPASTGHARPEALCSGEVVLSSPSSLVRPQPPVWSPLGDFPFCGYTPSLCHAVGSWLGSRPSPL